MKRAEIPHRTTPMPDPLMTFTGQSKSQNLLNQNAIAENLSARPKGFWKAIVLDVLTVLAAVGVGYCYSRYLAGALSPYYVLGALAFFTVLAVLGSLLVEDAGRRLLVLALEVLGMLAFFYATDWRFLFGAASIMFFFLLAGEVMSRRELSNGLEIKFVRAMKPTVNKILTAVLLGAIILHLPAMDAARTFLTEPVFDVLFENSADSMRYVYPEIKADATIQEFVESLATYGVQRNVSGLASEEQAQLVAVVSDQLRGQMSLGLGVPLEPHEKVQAVVYAYVQKLLGDSRDRFGATFLVAWAFIIFFTIRSVGFIFTWGLTLISFCIYEFLIALNAITLAGESRIHEVARFS